MGYNPTSPTKGKAFMERDLEQMLAILRRLARPGRKQAVDLMLRASAIILEEDRASFYPPPPPLLSPLPPSLPETRN